MLLNKDLSLNFSTNQIKPLLDVTDLEERLNGMTGAKEVVGVDFDDVVGSEEAVPGGEVAVNDGPGPGREVGHAVGDLQGHLEQRLQRENTLSVRKLISRCTLL